MQRTHVHIIIGLYNIVEVGCSSSFNFMSCSVALDVMPHSATSRATGDDTSTMVDWNSGE